MNNARQFLEKLKVRWESISPKQKKIIFMAALLVLGMVLLWRDNEEEEAKVPPVANEEKHDVAVTRIYTDQKIEGIIRDPFTFVHNKEVARTEDKAIEQPKVQQGAKKEEVIKGEIREKKPRSNKAGQGQGGKVQNLQLKGVVIFNGIATALIEDQQGSRSVKVGDEVAGGKVITISKSAMVVAINGEYRTYRLN